MSPKQNLLFEIGTEELPPKMLAKLSQQLADAMKALLDQEALRYGAVKAYGSPRHLAVMIQDLDTVQPSRHVEKKGPALKQAFDAMGKPTPAALGFARSCGTDISELQQKIINQEAFLVYAYTVAGKPTQALLPDLCRQAVKKLPIPKPMRWGDTDIEFVRPVHWAVLLFGKDLIETEILGVRTQKHTYGHRFHHPQALPLKHADNYVAELKHAGFVMVDFDERRKNIRAQIKTIAKDMQAIAVIDDDLLDEVTGLTEWPVALLANFDEAFLQIPEEALISAMQTHQKAFHLMNQEGHLLPHFIMVANIKSKKTERVIAGYERVMRARLADAAFFYQTDGKTRLESRLQNLESIIFHKKLGNVYQRSLRISRLAEYIAEQLKLDQSIAARAGLLAKADLVSDMVKEFPELQGVMGYYYALNDRLPETVAMAIRGQYMPRFSGDTLPQTDYGCVVSLADRLDKLAGIFGVNEKPSGEKDPFALRRAAIGALQIMIKKAYPLDLSVLIKQAIENYHAPFMNKNVFDDVLNFFRDRLHHLYQEQGIAVDILNAVAEIESDKPYDFCLRLKAVESFLKMPESHALAAANKRVSNLLAKAERGEISDTFDINLLTENAEKDLAQAIMMKREMIQALIAKRDYTAILTRLADLQKPVDAFFDGVMVMTDNPPIRKNRLALLAALRCLFLEVADISKLQA